MSAEDNIVKGTAGQAIQCFNIVMRYCGNDGTLLIWRSRDSK